MANSIIQKIYIGIDANGNPIYARQFSKAYEFVLTLSGTSTATITAANLSGATHAFISSAGGANGRPELVSGIIIEV